MKYASSFKSPTAVNASSTEKFSCSTNRSQNTIGLESKDNVMNDTRNLNEKLSIHVTSRNNIRTNNECAAEGTEIEPEDSIESDYEENHVAISLGDSKDHIRSQSVEFDVGHAVLYAENGEEDTAVSVHASLAEDLDAISDDDHNNKDIDGSIHDENVAESETFGDTITDALEGRDGDRCSLLCLDHTVVTNRDVNVCVQESNATANLDKNLNEQTNNPTIAKLNTPVEAFPLYTCNQLQKDGNIMTSTRQYHIVKEVGTESNKEVVSKWTNYDNHVLILSNSGKPIYSRYGHENQLASLFGAITALASTTREIATFGGGLKTLTAGNTKFHFYEKYPLIYVVVGRGGWQSHAYLQAKAEYLHNHVVSCLTNTQLQRVFNLHHNFDLRRLLSNKSNDARIGRLVKRLDVDPCYLLGAVNSLVLPPVVRDTIGSILLETRSPAVVFALMLTSTHLVSLLRPRNHGLDPKDIHLLMNIVGADDEERERIRNLTQQHEQCKGQAQPGTHGRKVGDGLLQRTSKNEQHCPSHCNVATGHREGEGEGVTVDSDLSLKRLSEQYDNPSTPTDPYLGASAHQSNRVEQNGHGIDSDGPDRWVPICLPEFNNTGYMYAHVSHIDVNKTVTLMLISTERDDATRTELRATRNRIVSLLIESDMISSVVLSVASCHNQNVVRLDPGLFANASERKGDKLDVKYVRQFVYKSKTTCQMVSSVPAPPYAHVKEREGLLRMYSKIRELMYSRKLVLYYHVSDVESVLGWNTHSYEMYSVFGPLVLKRQAVGAVNVLLEWIKKKENEMFILKPHVW
eukprot:CFRG2994T1